MRKSQQTLFWRNHRIVGIRVNGKIVRWYGKKFPKTAQDYIDEVYNK